MSLSAPHLQCSSCAAGGMQRSNPTVDKETWLAVTKSFIPFTRYLFGGTREPYQFFHIDWFDTLSDPFFLRWSAMFAKTSLFPSDQNRSQMDQLSFTNYAVRHLVEMMENNSSMAKKTGFNPTGSLSLSYDVVDTKQKAANPTHGNTLEPSKQLEGEDITLLEPSVKNQEQQPTSAKFEFETCAASSERFTEELANRCVNDPKLDVKFLYDTRVKGVSTAQGGQRRIVTQIQTNRGVIDVKDAQVLIAAGAWTPHIAAMMGLYAPVYPLKGYAMSISAKEALASNTLLKPSDLPTRIVCDKYMFTSRLGDEVRVTSIGEFSGWSTSPTASVEKEFRREAVRQFPMLESFIKEAKVKCGHRPYVSDGILLLGRVEEFGNLLVSCGPGSNGWKLAVGSGSIVEMLVSGKTEDQISDELGFDVRSLSPAGRVVESPIFAKLCRARWGVGNERGSNVLRVN
jgi:glycine/D-amino acid oxidase-like deaminating enzyme